MGKNKRIKIELTQKQLEYLNTAFFEFGEMFPDAGGEYLFKTIQKKMYKSLRKLENE